ncbi:MAG: LysE family translocator, partial [Pseudomonadota bacterium]
IKIAFMNIEILVALLIFGFVASVTPGPNNLMLMSSGANYGVRRSLPHVFGITGGFILMVVLVGLGLMRIFEQYPISFEILRGFSIVYLSYLAWKIATSGNVGTREGGKPLTSLQAAMFQWVNPKAWAFALSALTLYAPSQSLGAVALVALILGGVNLPSIFVWVVLGQNLQRILQKPGRMKVFNLVMAMMLVATLYPILFA